jgi:indole-3-glycerol phosphate synthase
MNILDEIIQYKKSEVGKRKSEISLSELEKRVLFNRPTLSLKRSLLDTGKTGIIAEFKRRSPSKGVINAGADVVKVTTAFTDNGASGLSVLTDEHFFGGSDEDLVKARSNNIPLLRKEFIIDEYQLVEAKSIGADVILLIAACLSPAEVKKLARVAKNLGLEVLLELHGEEEIDHICEEAELIGINNRDLKTFTVDIERSLRMAAMIPAAKVRVAESGIDSVDTITHFKNNGFQGFLIGESFMKQPDPTIAFAEFVKLLSLSPTGA